MQGQAGVCTVEEVAWLTPFPRWYSRRAVGIQGLIVGGSDVTGIDYQDDTGFSFEHFTGVLLQVCACVCVCCVCA